MHSITLSPFLGRFCMYLAHINSLCTVEAAISALGAETSRLMEYWGHTHADCCIKGLECLWGQMCLEARETSKDLLIGWKRKQIKRRRFLHHKAGMDRCQTLTQRQTWLAVSEHILQSCFLSQKLCLLTITQEVRLRSQCRGYRVDNSTPTPQTDTPLGFIAFCRIVI